MPIGITEDHAALHESVARLARPSLPAGGDCDARSTPSAKWRRRSGRSSRAQGWLGLHVAEALGGSGFGVRRGWRRGRGARPTRSRPGPALADPARHRRDRALDERARPAGPAARHSHGAMPSARSPAGPAADCAPTRPTGPAGSRERCGRCSEGHLADVLVAPCRTDDGATWVALDLADPAVATRRAAERRPDPPRRGGPRRRRARFTPIGASTA